MNPLAREAIELSLQVQPLLKGRHPFVQGAALADLLAIWLKGYPEPMRAELLLAHIRTVRELVEHS